MNKIISIISLFLLLSCANHNPNSAENKPKTIAIQAFDDFEKPLIDTLSVAIKKFYEFKVTILPPKSIPKSAFINIKSPRYRADSIIKFLKQSKPDSIDHIIGLTTKDISTTKKDKNGNTKKPEYKYSDWGIFGLGYRPGPSCIVSTYRLKHPNQKKYIIRFKKIALHELGHNLGLQHCSSKNCIMRDANETIKTIDNVDMILCDNCNKKLHQENHNSAH